MKIILKENVEKLGKCGEIIKVKEGFARNFLIPKGLAVLATLANLRQLEEEEKRKTQQLDRDKKEAQNLALRLEGLSVNVAVETYEEDKLYGSVTALDITRALDEEGIKIDKKCIILNEPIKTLGIFDCMIKLHPEVETKIKVWVVKKK